MVPEAALSVKTYATQNESVQIRGKLDVIDRKLKPLVIGSTVGKRAKMRGKYYSWDYFELVGYLDPQCTLK